MTRRPQLPHRQWSLNSEVCPATRRRRIFRLTPGYVVSGVLLISLAALCGIAQSARGTSAPSVVPIPQTTVAPVVLATGPQGRPAGPSWISAISTCDVASAALKADTALTADVTALRQRAVLALYRDTSAPRAARIHASHYLTRDRNNPSLREVDRMLIIKACSR